MRWCFLALSLVCPLVVAAAPEDLRVVRIINDTRTQIVSFAVASAGSGRWRTIEFTRRPFDYGLVFTLAWHDDDGCLRDFRTMLSDGRRIDARGFDLCGPDTAYWPGRFFHHGRQVEMPSL